MDHGKVAVNTFINALILDLFISFPQLGSISFFSDRTASQLKQKYLFPNLMFMLEEHNIMTIWSFFSTSHGKRAVDCIDGNSSKVCLQKQGKLCT